mmetsp:Transcript_3400/g.4865  ORF Transcript_3400/g.4865 Transcript_3400/m.4865 type:complete len:100 (+) Transcript_3400:632-931(+)
MVVFGNTVGGRATTANELQAFLPPVPLEVPCSVVQRTSISSLQPFRYTMKVKSVVANTPSHNTLLRPYDSRLFGLALYTKIHDMVSADCAVVNPDVPCP